MHNPERLGMKHESHDSLVSPQSSDFSRTAASRSSLLCIDWLSLNLRVIDLVKPVDIDRRHKVIKRIVAVVDGINRIIDQ